MKKTPPKHLPGLDKPPTGMDEVIPEETTSFSVSDVQEVWKEVKLLRKKNILLKLKLKHCELRLKNHGFCPDCRDKLDGECWRCKCQHLENRMEIRNHVHNNALEEAVQACKGYGDDDLDAKHFQEVIRGLKV